MSTTTDTAAVDARDAAGEIIEQITDPETGKSIATIRRLPKGLLAVDVEGDEALALAQHFLPPTQKGVTTSASGKKKYRFLYRDTTDGGGS
jgi:hypothetical protein